MTSNQSFDSRRRLIALALLVFFATFFAYAHTDLFDIFYHLFVDGCFLAAWLVSAWGFGRWIVPHLSSSHDREDAMQKSRAVLGPPRGEDAPALPNISLLIHLTRIAVGLGVLSILILLLGLAGCFGEISALILLAVGFVLTLFAIASQHDKRKKPGSSIRRWLSAPAGAHWLFILLAPFAGMMAAGGLIMPGLLWGADDPSGYDVVEYHLQVPREWFELGRITPLHHNVFSYFPFNVEMHYLLAMNLHAGPWAGMFLAQWMHGVFIALTIVSIYAAVRTFASPFAACLAAVAAGFCPWLTMLGSVAYDEGGLLLYSTLAIAWLIVLLANENSTMKRAIVAGLCAGFACGCKLTGVPILLIALPIIFFLSRLGRPAISPSPGTPGEGRGEGTLMSKGKTALTLTLSRNTGRGNKTALFAMLTYIAIALLVFSPWLIRNQIWAHNPVFPEEMSLLGHAHFSEIQAERWHRAHSPRPDQHSVAAHLDAFWSQIIIDWRFAYALLPISLLAAFSSLRNRNARFLLLSLAAMILFWLLLTHLQSRFFVAAIPIMAILLGVTAPNFLKWIAIPIVLSAFPAFFLVHQELYPLSQTIGLESPTLLRSQIYPPQVNAAVAEDKPLILVGDAKAFWFDIPMSRLHYRTVFDVDTSDNRSLLFAWIGSTANLSDANVIIDPNELDRFSRTYLGIPELPRSLSDLHQPTVFDLHDLPAIENK